MRCTRRGRWHNRVARLRGGAAHKIAVGRASCVEDWDAADQIAGEAEKKAAQKAEAPQKAAKTSVCRTAPPREPLAKKPRCVRAA